MRYSFSLLNPHQQCKNELSIKLIPVPGKLQGISHHLVLDQSHWSLSHQSSWDKRPRGNELTGYYQIALRTIPSCNLDTVICDLCTPKGAEVIIYSSLSGLRIMTAFMTWGNVTWHHNTQIMMGFEIYGIAWYLQIMCNCERAVKTPFINIGEYFSIMDWEQRSNTVSCLN